MLEEQEANRKNNRDDLRIGVEAVITSFNQGTMIFEAVQSLCSQTVLPRRIIIVDDGSTDDFSLNVLKDMERNPDLPIPIMIHYQKMAGYRLQEMLA